MKSEPHQAHLEVARVLKQLADTDAAARWEIHSLGQGDQARLFLAQYGQASMGQSDENPVVVKLYKEVVAADRQAFVSEKNGLKVLSELLPKTVGDGWSIRSPVLLYASDDPLALVMSSLPGVPLDVWLHANTPTSTQAESIVAAFLASLQALWSEGFMYGDLNLKNVLYDSAHQTLSFIDPGLPAAYYRCEDVDQQWYPMSRDIAYLLFSVAVSVKSTLGNPAARKRQKLVVSLLVRRYVESFGSSQQQTLLLGEIRSCTRTHLHELKGSWSPSGIWRHFVRQITQRSLNRTLEQLTVQREEVQV